MSLTADMLGSLYGMRVVESVNVGERKQFRFPRSRRRRIQKKWRRDPRNWRTRANGEYLFVKQPRGGQMIVCHPEDARRLRKRLAMDEGIRWGPAAFASSYPASDR